MLSRALKWILPLPLSLLVWAMVVRGWAVALLADPAADFGGWLVGAVLGFLVGLALTALCAAHRRSLRGTVGVLLLLSLCCAALADTLSQLMRIQIPGALPILTLLCLATSLVTAYAVRSVP
jgi:hypothetical protein